LAASVIATTSQIDFNSINSIINSIRDPWGSFADLVLLIIQTLAIVHPLEMLFPDLNLLCLPATSASLLFHADCLQSHSFGL
jgi:hypothetical protein